MSFMVVPYFLSERPIIDRVVVITSGLVWTDGEIVNVDAPEQGPALGRHRLDQLMRQVQPVILRGDRVVGRENRHSLDIGVLPGHRGVQDGLAKDDQRARWT